MDLELRFDSLKQASEAGYHIVDIREGYEVEHSPIEDAAYTHAPMRDLLQGSPGLDPGRKHLLVCAHGVRSLGVAAELRRRGMGEVYSLGGGLAGVYGE